MADDLKVSGPVTVKNDSAERVAYDMMLHIAGYEQGNPEKSKREYWLKLYQQCLSAQTLRLSVKSIMGRD